VHCTDDDQLWRRDVNVDKEVYCLAGKRECEASTLPAGQLTKDPHTRQLVELRQPQMAQLLAARPHKQLFANSWPGNDRGYCNRPALFDSLEQLIVEF
jgi:hypothetical protein